MSSPSTSTLRIVTPLTSHDLTVAPLKLVLTKVAPSKPWVSEEVVILAFLSLDVDRPSPSTVLAYIRSTDKNRSVMRETVCTETGAIETTVRIESESELYPWTC